VPDPVEDSSGGIDAAHFRTVLGHFPTGVTVVTAMGDDGPAGLAVGSFFSVSLHPPLVGFCPNKASSNWPAIKAAGVFCVNILAEDQEDLCRVFAAKGGDKFSGIGWHPSSTGSPRLNDVLAWIDCEIDAVHDAGDHEVCIGRVRELDVERHREGPLVFFRGGYGRFEF
jgi:3-hydroxy-9,10-secoandrosta-1,3,5(10)-triene-9,17-dione monooxygenase reductase component